MASPSWAQVRFRADPAPVSQRISYRHERSAVCPLPSVTGPNGSRPAGPVTESMAGYFSGGTRFSCPILHFDNASVSFAHPLGGMLGEVQPDVASPTIVNLPEGPSMTVTATGSPRDDEGGDRHGFLAAVAGNINPNRQDRAPLNASGCTAADGKTSQTPSSGPPLTATANCTLTQLRILSRTSMDGQLHSFEAELVSDAWFKADHGTGRVGDIQNGARYRVTLTTVYKFVTLPPDEQNLDSITATEPSPPLSEPLSLDSGHELRATGNFRLASVEKGDIIGRVFDQTGKQLTRSEAIPVERGEGAERVISAAFAPGENVSRIRYILYLRDEAGNVLAQSSPLEWETSLELTIQRMEIVQVVQDVQNGVPMIEHKPTVVRVFTKLDTENVQAWGPSDVELHGSRFGTPLPNSPLLLSAVSVKNPDRREQSHSHDFLLPASWLEAGPLELRAKVNADEVPKEIDFSDNEKTMVANFSRSKPLRIAWVNVCWDLGDSNPCANGGGGSPELLLRDIFPVDPTKLTFKPFPVNYFQFTPPPTSFLSYLPTWMAQGYNEKIVIAQLSRLYWRLMRGTNRFSRPFDNLIGWVPNDPKLPLLTDGNSELPGHAVYVADLARTDIGLLHRTVPHEIGHNYGLRHTNKPDSNGALDSYSDWPFENSDTQELGFSPREGVIKLGMRYQHRLPFKDIMSYNNVQWISRFHYMKLFNQFLERDIDVIRQDALDRYALISGYVFADGSDAQLDPVIEVRTDEGDALDPDGNHCIEFSGAGGVLGSSCFQLDFLHAGRNVPLALEYFSKLVPYPEGATTVRLLQNGKEVATLTSSASAPTVEINAPAPNATWDAATPQTIRWTGQDADGEALTYTISHSADGGQTWLPLAQDVAGTELTVDASRIFGGSGIRFRVEASDGFRQGSAEVGPVEVIQQPAISAANPSNLGRSPASVGASRFVAVGNPGTGPLTIRSMTVDDESFTVDPAQFPLTVPAGGEASIAVQFEFPEVGVQQASATILSDAVGAPTLTFSIRAEADSGETPVAVVEGDERRFLPAFLGESTESGVLVANESLVDLTLDSSVTGSAMSLGPSSPTVVLPGEAELVPVLFMPANEGEHLGELTIRTNDPAHSTIRIRLRGEGFEAPAVGPQLPTISAGGVVDAAQFKATLSPGGLGSIFGSNLAPQIAGATSTPLPTELAGVSIEVNGVAAPLIFVSPNQINFQMPFEAAGANSVEIRAVRDGIAGPTVSAAVSTYAPQVFANPATGEPIVIRQDGSLVDAAHPAVDQDVLTIFLTGVGGLDNPPATGAATPGSPLASATAETTVTIGGQPAEVFFLGLTPGFVGLVQANIRAHIPALPGAALSPEGSGALTSLPLVVTVGGAASEPLAMPADVPGGLPPQIDFQPVGLDFGEVALGQSSQLALTVFNRGGSGLTVGSVSTSTGEFAALASTGPWVIAPGGSQQIQVTFAPAEEGTRFGALTLSSNDPVRPEITIPLVGRGVGETTPGQLSISPSTVEFGSVEVGQTASRDVTINNTGGSAISLNGLSSSAANEFSVQPMGAALPVEIPPGGAYPARIVFQPTAAGDRSATLTASSGSSGVNATLRGTGVAAPPPASALVVTRSVLNFGPVSFGRTNELPVVVRNDGAAGESITAVVSTDAQFRLDSPAAPIAIGPGQEVLLRIHFTPVNAGLQQATLTVQTAAGPLPTTVAMTGTGQQGPKVLFSDSFERPDAATCAVGAADNAYGGSGTHRYAAIAAGVRLRNGVLENAARDFGGAAFSTEGSACPGAATTTGQDLNIRAKVLVPRSGDRTTQAGPFFHAPLMASGARLEGGGQAGHWVQLDSSGGVLVFRLDTWQQVAVSLPLPGFDPTQPHTIEVAVRGATAEVAIDGRLRLFDQGGGTGRQTINLVPTGSLSQGAAGIGFSAYNGPGSVGGQTVDDIVVTEHESLAGLPVAR